MVAPFGVVSSSLMCLAWPYFSASSFRHQVEVQVLLTCYTQGSRACHCKAHWFTVTPTFRQGGRAPASPHGKQKPCTRVTALDAAVCL
jgi:hypothetical protein